MERRRAIRYRVQLPVIFFWENGPGIRCSGEGVTRNVSEVGAYVLSVTCPPLGGEVETEMFSSGHSRAPKVLLKGQMKVLRVDDQPASPGGFGFALAGKVKP